MSSFLSQLDTATTAGYVAAFFLGLTVVSTAIGYLFERVLRARPIFALPLDPGQTRHELIGNALFLLVTIASMTAALRFELVRLADANGLSADANGLGAMATFVALFGLFQVYYYYLHRVMHTRALVRFHRFHHVSRVTTPLTGQSMGFVEALGWMVGYIGLPAVLSLWIPVSPIGWLAYLTYNVFGNIVGHANVEPVPHLPGLRLTSLVSNAFIYHALHHARWVGNYNFGTALMDRMAGTELSDWQTLHARVAAGEPLRSLKERAPSTNAAS